MLTEPGVSRRARQFPKTTRPQRQRRAASAGERRTAHRASGWQRGLCAPGLLAGRRRRSNGQPDALCFRSGRCRCRSAPPPSTPLTGKFCLAKSSTSRCPTATRCRRSCVRPAPALRPEAPRPRVAASRGRLEGVAPDAGPRQPTGGCLNAFAAGGDRLAPRGRTLVICTLAPGLLCHDVMPPAVPNAYTPKSALYLALMASPWASTVPGSSRITLI
jgi:hypothetical protein